MARNPFDESEPTQDDLWSAAASLQERTPDLEIIEERDNLYITCELPGIEREDIRVDVSPQRVVVTANSRALSDPLRGGFLRRDRAFGNFDRVITLPAEVRPDDAEAHFNNGVLEVVLPKRVPGGVGVYHLPV